MYRAVALFYSAPLALQLSITLVREPPNCRVVCRFVDGFCPLWRCARAATSAARPLQTLTAPDLEALLTFDQARVALCTQENFQRMLSFWELFPQPKSCPRQPHGLHRGLAPYFFDSQRGIRNITGQIKPISPMKPRFSPVASRLPLGSSYPGGDLSNF